MATRMAFVKLGWTNSIVTAHLARSAIPRRRTLRPSACSVTTPRSMIQLQHRSYSAEAAAPSTGTTAVEPPDFLDEAELDIFKTIKSHLEPTSLEVSHTAG